MNIYDLISRAQKLRKETQLDSVSPDRVGGLHEDTLKYINEFQLLASSPSLHKAYASVSAMQSDKSPKSDLTGKPLKPGQLVVIVPANQTDATAGDVYRYDGPSGNTSAWTFVAKIGAVPADAELSATSTNPPQNKVVTEKLTELESEIDIRPIHGIEYDITPTKFEENTLYRIDGTTTLLNGYSAKTYNLSVGVVVKIKVIKDFPSADLSIIAYRNADGEFKNILSSPLNASEQATIYITITSEMRELIVVGSALLGVNIDYKPITQDDAAKLKDYIDLLYTEREDGWINAENIKTESSLFYLYKFDVRNSTKLKVYFASLEAYALFLDADNNIVGEPFQSSKNELDYGASVWSEVDVPVGAVYLNLSHLKASANYPLAYPCRVLANEQNFDEISDVIIRKDYVDAFYAEKKKYWVSKDNVETRSDLYNLYYFDVNGIERVKIFFATGGAYALFLDADNNIVGEPFQSEFINRDHYVSAWSEIEVPGNATILKVSSINPYINYAKELGTISPCRVLFYKSNNDSLQEKVDEIKKNITLDYIDLIYSSRKNGWINAENIENANAALYLYDFDVRNSTKLKVYFASASGYALFLDADNNIVGEPFQSTPMNGNNSFASTWKDVEVPQGAITLRLSHVKLSNSYPLAYPCRVLADKQNYDKLKLGKSVINKTMVNVGMSIWWQDGRTFPENNLIDGNGTLVKGYQTLLQEVFIFDNVIKYAYSGFSLGIGDVESSSIMATMADTWTSQPNAIWTLDTITNDFGRDVPLGEPSDFDNATGITTFYGALRAFRDRVLQLTQNPIVICSNALYRTKKQNGLGLGLEDYETAMCYAAAKSGWYFVDQYRNSINDANINVALYDGLHATNFGFRLAVKPWVEQFRILQSIL